MEFSMHSLRQHAHSTQNLLTKLTDDIYRRDWNFDYTWNLWPLLCIFLLVLFCLMLQEIVWTMIRWKLFISFFLHSLPPFIWFGSFLKNRLSCELSLCCWCCWWCNERILFNNIYKATCTHLSRKRKENEPQFMNSCVR